MSAASVSRWVERLLLLAGAILLGAWSRTAIEARAWQLAGAARLQVIASQPGVERARARAVARSRGIVGRIQVPRLGLSAVVGEGTSDRTLARAVGHLRRSALPGENGNVVLAGHRDTYFRKLRGVRRGDLIRVTTPDGEFRYRVESLAVVDPGRRDVLEHGRRPALTLVTCYPFEAIGPAPRRFVVRARPEEADRAS
jgi:sortase A